MVLYNITYNVDQEIQEAWMQWMRAVHIPRMMMAGKFSSVRLFEMLSTEEQGNTYSLQFMADSLEIIQKFLEDYEPVFSQEQNTRFGNKHVAFRTVLQELEI